MSANEQMGKRTTVEDATVVTMHSPESERGALSCCLQDASSVDFCMARIPSEKWFWDLRHKTLYVSLRAMHAAGKGVDLVTLVTHLKNEHLLEKVGGQEYLLAVMDAVPSVAQLPVYLDELREKYRLRHVTQIMAETQLTIRDHPGDSQKAIDSLEVGLMVMESGSSKDTILTARQGATMVIDIIDDYRKGLGTFEGIRTGYEYFDTLLGGLRGGELTVLAGRPGMGKSSFAMNIIEHVAVKEKIPVGFFSIEMPAKLTFGRMAFQIARCNFQKFRTGCMPNSDWVRLEEALKEMGEAPLYVDFDDTMNIMQLRAKARQMVKMHGVRAIFIDYFQLIRPTSDFGGNENLGLQEISKGLMTLAKELDIPVVVLSQLNRDIEKDQSKNSDATRRPKMADLRGTGSLEQDASNVVILYRPKLNEDEEAFEAKYRSWDDTRVRVNPYVAKSRNGPTGDCELVFHKSCTSFYDWKRGSGSATELPHAPTAQQLPPPKVDELDYPPEDMYLEN